MCACGKRAEPGRDECFRCRVSTVGFTFVGGGSYGQRRFNDMTVSERRSQILGDRVLGVDVEPASNYGW